MDLLAECTIRLLALKRNEYWAIPFESPVWERVEHQSDGLDELEGGGFISLDVMDE